MNWLDLDEIPRSLWFEVLRKSLREGFSIAVCKTSEIDTARVMLPTELTEQQIGIFSGGTTGDPKLVCHSVERLLSVPSKPEMVLATLYSPDRMAGLQALVHGIKSGNRAYFLGLPLVSADISAEMSSSVTHISATPSQMRFTDLRVLHQFNALQAITLGGEAVTPTDIRRIKSELPQVRIYQIYASSEFGQMCTVRDEKPGLPLGYFTGENRRFEISVNGELLFRPRAHGAQSFLPTGDLARVEQNRVVFAGRKDLLISVGGILRSPEEIEATIVGWPEVAACVVKIKRSAMTGSVLVAEVLLESEVEIPVLYKRMMALPPNQQAQIIKKVSEFEMTPAGKIARRYE